MKGCGFIMNSERFTDNDENIVLLKFCKELKFAEDIQRGRLYGNTASFYRELENNSGNDIQGDSNEVIYTKKSEKSYRMNDKYFLECTVTESKYYEDDKKIPIVCFMGFKKEELIYEEGYYSFPIDDDRLDTFKKEFGEYCVMCLKKEVDILLEEYCTKKFVETYDYKFKEVMYMDTSTDEYKEIFESGTMERFFYKKLKYSDQHEYRIVIGMDVLNSENRYIEIGEIQDLCGFKADKLKELKFNYWV